MLRLRSYLGRNQLTSLANVATAIYSSLSCPGAPGGPYLRGLFLNDNYNLQGTLDDAGQLLALTGAAGVVWAQQGVLFRAPFAPLGTEGCPHGAQ